MLKIRAAAIRDLADLHACLQRAIELEHATLPPYLTALYSIKEGANEEAAALIRSVVMQEMLHMTLAANLLNAIGGHPSINSPDFIPSYPGPLPMGIGDEGEQLFIVPIRKLSRQLLFDVFMTIEEPEEPLVFPHVAAALAALPSDRYQTIGQFYTAIKNTIVELGPGIFTGDIGYQVTGWLPDLIAVGSVEEAVAAIDTIVSQGEGTRRSPLDDEGEIAHYYRFAEIYYGRHLVKDPDAQHGYSYSGEPIGLDPAGIWPMIDNPNAASFKPGSTAERLANQFNYTYGGLLNALHGAFNGQPEKMGDAVGLMFSLRLQAEKLMSTYVSEACTAGPTWRYVSINR